MEGAGRYPAPFRYLDDEHAEIIALVAALKKATGSDGENSAAFLSKRLFQKIAEHTSHEEDLMKTSGYPERELHEKYHEHISHSIDLVLQLFDHSAMDQHGAAIAKHIGNKMAEEIFVDRLFAEFLTEQSARE